MSKVILFPQKRRLPKGVEDHLCEIAKDYVATIRSAAILMDLETNDTTQAEIMELVGEAFAKGIYEAIEEME